jgi:D-alanine-D-alanine ligase
VTLDNRTCFIVNLRDRLSCLACGRTPERRDGYHRGFEYHHVVPKSMGGLDDASNIALVCHACHLAGHQGKRNLTEVLKNCDLTPPQRFSCCSCAAMLLTENVEMNCGWYRCSQCETQIHLFDHVFGGAGMKKNVALLVGGWSSEREVSLMKGRHVEAALKEAGYNVKTIDVSRDVPKLVKDLAGFRPDAVFNNLYGRGGEDGTIQALLEMLGYAYTHSGVVASAVGMDKVLTKKLAESVGVRCSVGQVASKKDILAEAVMPRPYVVKPINEGSSVGVRIILEGENQMPIDEASWSFGEEALVEKYVPGREIHVAVLDGKALGVTEIIVHGHRFFDYEAKYHDTTTELVTPAAIPEIVAETAKKYAAAVYNVLGCKGIARADLRYDDSKPGADGVYLLEINTMPGLSPGSIAVIQPEHNGMSYVELCSHLVETAQCHAQAQDAPPSSKDAPLAQSA